MGRQKIHPHLDDELRRRFKQYCAAKDVTESSVVEAALEQYLGGTDDKTLLLKRLDRLGRGVSRLEHGVEVLTEAFGLFVRSYYMHTPEVQTDARDSARRSAGHRWEVFLDSLRAAVAGEGRLVKDLVDETLADEEELARTSQKASSAAAK